MKNKFVVISDIHFPYQDDKAIKAALDFIKTNPVDTIILNGDILDFYDVSSFDKDPDRINSLQEEINMAEKFFKKLRTIKPDARIVFIKGNHCLDKRTDILTTDGWINIKDIVEQRKKVTLLNYDIQRDCIVTDTIQDYIKSYQKEMIEIETRMSKQIVSDKHQVLLGDEKVLAKDIYNEQTKHLSHLIKPCSNTLIPYSGKLSVNEVRLLTWVVTDGCIVSYSNKKKRIQFKLSKPRKIEALKELLEEMNIKYTFRLCKKYGVNKLQPYYIRIYGEDARVIFNLLNGKKEFPQEFKNLTGEHFEAFINTIVITDGCQKDARNYFYSVNDNDLDILQEACIKNGYATKINIQSTSGFNSKNRTKTLMLQTNYKYGRQQQSIKKISYNDYSYCLTTKKGTLITRIDGKVAITGNCERIQRYLKKHPELYSLDALKLPNLLGLDKFNIEYSDKGIKLGSLKIIHGTIVRKFSGYTARAEMEKNDCSGISGHCFSEDVEVLTPNGWVPIIDVNIGDTVGTINKTTQAFEFNKVNDKFVYDNYKELYHIKSTVVDVMVTDKHGLLGFNQDNNKLEEFDAKYLATTGKRYKFMCAALQNNDNGLELSETFIRLLVNISADGSLEDNEIRFHLKKERKIAHLKALLNELGYQYSEVKTKFGTTKIRIKSKYAKPIINTYFPTGKHLPTILRDVNKEQALIILDEYSLTDGNKNKDAKNSYQISSKKTTELDLLQEIFSKNGIRSSQLKRISHSILTVNTNPLTCISRDNVTVVPYKGRVSCVSVDNGTLIIRSKGKTLVTQNTHRLAVYYKRTPSRDLMWAESGCLCDLNPEYIDNPSWNQGFLYGYVEKDSFSIMPVPIVNGKIKCVLLED